MSTSSPAAARGGVDSSPTQNAIADDSPGRGKKRKLTKETYTQSRGRFEDVIDLTGDDDERRVASTSSSAATSSGGGSSSTGDVIDLTGDD